MSPREAGQKALGRETSHQITYLKVYSYKCYALLKDKEIIHKPKKSNKLTPRAFVGFLIGYNSSNIYRVWDPVKKEVKGYKDIIFNERVTYHPSIKDNIKNEREKIKQNHTINFTVYKAKPYYNKLKEDKLKYLDTRFSQHIQDLQEEEEKKPEKVPLPANHDNKEINLLTPKSLTPQIKTPPRGLTGNN